MSLGWTAGFMALFGVVVIDLRRECIPTFKTIWQLASIMVNNINM